MASGYVTHPGGVFVQLLDGSTHHALYGEYVDEETLAEHQREATTYTDHIDGQPRKPEHELAERKDEAKAAVKEANIDLSAVPENYGELDEEEAQGVVRSYKGKPAEQAQVVVHEKLTANRQGVIDAASKSALAKADAILSDIKGQADADAVPPPTGAPWEVAAPGDNSGTGETEGDIAPEPAVPEDEPSPADESGTGDVPPPTGKSEGE